MDLTYRTVMAYPGKEYGNGFLFRPSVTPVADQVVPLPRVDQLGWVARLKTEGGVPDTKSAFAQVFGVGGRRVRVVSLHLDFAGGADHRVRQLTHLLGTLERTAETAGAAVDVLCGDFNTSGHHRSKAARARTQRVLDVALARGFTDCSAGVPWTSDLFSSIDDADPARRLLAVGRALGLRYRQKLDHLLVRGDASDGAGYGGRRAWPHAPPRVGPRAGGGGADIVRERHLDPRMVILQNHSIR